jgi:hypothetical protein
MDCPRVDAQVHVYEYDSNVVIWLGTSPEVYTPKRNKAIKGMVETFIGSLLVGGCRVVSDMGA